jgi:hypothetical protein
MVGLCKYCACRSDKDYCERTRCNVHASWYATELVKRIAELEEIERRWKNGEAYMGE